LHCGHFGSSVIGNTLNVDYKKWPWEYGNKRDLTRRTGTEFSSGLSEKVSADVATVLAGRAKDALFAVADGGAANNMV
jgi:hypothetical protein